MSTQKCKDERRKHILEWIWNLSREPISFSEVKQKLNEELKEVWEKELEFPIEGRIQ